MSFKTHTHTNFLQHNGISRYTHLRAHTKTHSAADFLPVVLAYSYWVNVFLFFFSSCFCCSVLDCHWTFITGPSLVSCGHWPSLKPLSFSTSGALIKQTSHCCLHRDPPSMYIKTYSLPLYHSPWYAFVLIYSETYRITSPVDHHPLSSHATYLYFSCPASKPSQSFVQ